MFYLTTENTDNFYQSFIFKVRKLLQNVITKDKLHYRKLTDKPKLKDETEKNKTLEEKGEKDNLKDVSDEISCNIDDVSLGIVANGLFNPLKLLLRDNNVFC